MKTINLREYYHGTRFKQILLNLLSNAIAYNKDGGKVIIEGRETDDKFLRISIVDTGTGIAKENQKTIFDMYHRFEQNSMEAKDGTGIGLTVSKLLVEQMAGRIGLDSEVGKGSTFWIELPLASNQEILIWEDAMRYGIDAIDHDHQTFISLTNNIFRNSLDETIIENEIMELIEFSRKHFLREETIMIVCDYPDYKIHYDLHRSFIEKINGIQYQWRNDQNPKTLHNLRVFLRKWLADHIYNADTEISQYTKGKDQKIKKALESLG